MIISNSDLLMISDQELISARISRAAFSIRVKKYFCPIMTKNSLCTRNCLECKSLLQGSLNNIKQRVRSTEAVVTWRLRGAVGIAAEKNSKRSKMLQKHIDSNGFKLPKSTGFDGLAEILDKL